MVRSYQAIDLEDEDADYTIAQLVTHLQGTYNSSDYDKVKKLLVRREARIRAGLLDGVVVGEVERLKSKAEDGFGEALEKFKGLVTWTENLEKKFNELEKQKEVLAAEVLRLRDVNEWLDIRVGDEERLRLKAEEEVKEFEKVGKENVELREENRVLREREEVLKLRVMELENKVEVEENLRVKAEENRDDTEELYQKLGLRVLKLENLMRTGSLENGRVASAAGVMEKGGSESVNSGRARIDGGVRRGFMVDLTDEGDSAALRDVKEGAGSEGRNSGRVRNDNGTRSDNLVDFTDGSEAAVLPVVIEVGGNEAVNLGRARNDNGAKSDSVVVPTDDHDAVPLGDGEIGNLMEGMTSFYP